MIFIKIDMIIFQQSREFDVKFEIINVKLKINTKIMKVKLNVNTNVFMSIKQVTQQLF